MRPTAEPTPPALKLRERIWLLLSQAVNSLFYGGDTDESLSARCWRERRDPAWARRRQRIDRWLGENHCMNVYLAQALREMHRAASAQPTQGSTP